MFAGRDFIIISSIEWDFLWQGPQEIAARLARNGNRVLYVENTGVRTPRLRDASRVASRLFKWASTFAARGLKTISPNLHICSPLVLPPFGGRLQRKLNRRFFLPFVRRAATRLKMREAVVLTFLPTDTAVDLIALLRSYSAGVVYYCVADFGELVSKPLRLIQSEQQLVESCDLVVAHCQELALRCSERAKNIHVIPYGVNLDVFPSPNGSNHGKGPHDKGGAREFPRPVIGYVGGLHKYLDLPLITSMAQARPDWSWVLIGPAQVSLSKLAKLPNVHLLGEFQHRELAKQIECFDVGIVPYITSTFTETVVPTKINEYLAMGKPVVSTALPAVRDAYGSSGTVLACEPLHDSFIAAIEEALKLPTNDAARAHRREVAALSDWSARLELICNLIEKAIEENSRPPHPKPQAHAARA